MDAHSSDAAMAANRQMADEPVTERGVATVRLRDNLRVTERVVEGIVSYVVLEPISKKYFHLGVTEYAAARLLDGERTVQDVARCIDRPDWTTARVAQFAAALVAAGLAQPCSDPDAAVAAGRAGDEPPTASWRPAAAAGRQSGARPLARLLSLAISQRFPLVDGHRAAARASSFLGWLFTPFGFTAWCILCLLGGGVIAANIGEFREELVEIIGGGMWPIMLGLWVVSKTLHELGHAVCARRRGVAVGPMGVILFFFAPLAYVDVTAAWLLRSRMARVQIALAGMYVDLFVAACAGLLWWCAAPGLLRHAAAQVFVIAGPASLLVNLNPLLRLDGYYVLADLLEIPNLRSLGRQRLVGWMEHLAFGDPLPSTTLCGWRRPVATLHAALSVIFHAVWILGILAAVLVWAGLLGVALGAVALLGWIVGPLVRWCLAIWRRPAGLRRRALLVTYAATVAAMLIVSLFLPNPLGRRLPLVVRYRDEQVARAPSAAFVRSVRIRSGQQVRAGQLLLQLEDPELRLRLLELRDEVEAALQRSRRYQLQGKTAAALGQAAGAASLQRQADQVQSQLDDLRIVAERDGTVVSPRLDRLVDRYVEPGEVLVRIADPSEKELLVSLASDEASALTHAALEHRTGRVRLHGGGRLRARLRPPQPRASDRVPHPALAATAGGPLAVLPLESATTDEERWRTRSPRLISVAEIDRATALRIRAGQQGRLTIEDDTPLAGRLLDYIQNLLDDTRQQHSS